VLRGVGRRAPPNRSHFPSRRARRKRTAEHRSIALLNTKEKVFPKRSGAAHPNASQNPTPHALGNPSVVAAGVPPAGVVGP